MNAATRRSVSAGPATVSYKLFTIIIIGLASIAVISACVLFAAPLPVSILLFVGTWIGLIALFEHTRFLQPMRFTEKEKGGPTTGDRPAGKKD